MGKSLRHDRSVNINVETNVKNTISNTENGHLYQSNFTATTSKKVKVFASINVVSWLLLLLLLLLHFFAQSS